MDGLSKYLRLVEQGDLLMIAQTGHEVARIMLEIADRKPLSPRKLVANNKGPELISDLVNQERI